MRSANGARYHPLCVVCIHPALFYILRCFFGQTDGSGQHGYVQYSLRVRGFHTLCADDRNIIPHEQLATDCCCTRMQDICLAAAGPGRRFSPVDAHTQSSLTHGLQKKVGKSLALYIHTVGAMMRSAATAVALLRPTTGRRKHDRHDNDGDMVPLTVRPNLPYNSASLGTTCTFRHETSSLPGRWQGEA